MKRRSPSPTVGHVVDADQAADLLRHPLRIAVLEQADAPRSATAIAARLGFPRQQINYHVQRLRAAGFLRPAGRRRRRGLVEQRFVATARRYLLAPNLLGALGATPQDIADPLSAAYLITLASRLHDEVAQAAGEAALEHKRLATMALSTEIRFATAAQRRRFLKALQRGVADLVSRRGTSAGRLYRLTVGCHPMPRGAAER